jgi:hypothetical protein
MRTIDADALMEKVCKNCPRYDCTPDATDTVYGCMFADSVESMPTIEPEVQCGRWIVHTTWHGMFGLIHSECSECKFDRNGDLSSWKFCPNCGADMRGVSEDDER